MRAQGYLHAALVAVFLGISSVGYYRDGSVPLLELALSSVLSSDRREEIRVSSSQSSQETCHCPPLTTSENSTPKFISSHLAEEKVVPLSQLKKKITFSKHNGLTYLGHCALNRYYLCKPTTAGHFAKNALSSKQCKERSFLHRDSPIVALISFPGSGNTWLRHLLEQATGIYTGSIYCDRSLKAMFPGEHIGMEVQYHCSRVSSTCYRNTFCPVSGNVLVVKTHHPDTRELPRDVQESTGKKFYDRAVVLVRNPYDALVSEANRRWNTKENLDSHVGLADETSFISNSRWNWYVESRSMSWGFLLHTWLAHSHLPVHVVQYERLVSNTREELDKVLQFLDSPADNITMNCALDNSGREFRRKKHLNFDPYSKENKALVNRALSLATPLLAQYGIHYKKR